MSERACGWGMSQGTKLPVRGHARHARACVHTHRSPNTHGHMKKPHTTCPEPPKTQRPLRVFTLPLPCQHSCLVSRPRCHLPLQPGAPEPQHAPLGTDVQRPVGAARSPARHQAHKDPATSCRPLPQSHQTKAAYFLMPGRGRMAEWAPGWAHTGPMRLHLAAGTKDGHLIPPVCVQRPH